MLTKKRVAALSAALLAWYWQKYIFRGPVYDKVKDLSGKTVFITGECESLPAVWHHFAGALVLDKVKVRPGKGINVCCLPKKSKFLCVCSHVKGSWDFREGKVKSIIVFFRNV